MAFACMATYLLESEADGIVLPQRMHASKLGLVGSQELHENYTMAKEF